jgi:tetratricopeptide (TPR) repeat protein
MWQRGLSWFVLSMCIVGCNRTAPTPAGTGPQAIPSSTQSAMQDVASEGTVTSADDKYQGVWRSALEALVDRRYDEALASLQAAKAIKDTEEVSQQIARVQALQLSLESFDRTIADIQAVIDQGQGATASQLAVLAMAQFTQEPEAGKLAALKRQADALQLAAQPDEAAQMARLRTTAETATKENNLRAAALAYEQWASLKPDAAVQRQAEAVKTRLNQYDAACDKARELRKESATMEDAIAEYQKALAVWDTQEVRAELADTQMLLGERREKLAIAPFEVQGDASLSVLSATMVDELLPHFKARYDLVERGLTQRLLDELKIDANDILVSDQGRADLGKLAKARYLVVGSVSPLAGVTVHARLIDLRTGLVVQTARLNAISVDAASKRLGEVAQQLQMSDNEKLAWEQRTTERDAVVAASSSTVNTSELPAYSSTGVPQPISYSTARPPQSGSLTVEDYDRLPPMQSGGVSQFAPGLVEQERPLRQRLLAVQLELGDNLFRRGLFLDAWRRYQLARELDPASLDILGRLSLCQQYLPPTPPPVRRTRLAILPFYIAASPQAIPSGWATWMQNQLMPYFDTTYDVIDPGEVHWMMGRLGITMGDVLHDASIRRWLGRAVGVRYFVVGRMQPLQGFIVTTALLDAEQGWETGRGQVMVQHLHELKHRLPELARLTMLSPAERVRLEREAALLEAEYQRALEANRRGQFQLALDLGNALRLKHPFNIRINVLLNDAHDQSRLAALKAARQQELAPQRALAEAAQRRQVELYLAAERARQEAARQVLAEVDRRRLQEQALQRMLSQARIAIQGKKFSVAVQLFDGAVAMRPSDEALMREAAAVRAQIERDRQAAWLVEQTQREEARRRQWSLDLAAGQQLWARDLQTFQSRRQSNFQLQQQHDASDYTKLLDQAQRLKAQGRLDEVAATLQLAKRLNPTDEVDRLLTDTLVEQARAQAKAQDAAKLAELERRLAQETARRKQAEILAQNNWTLYQRALQQAQAAVQARNFTVAVARYQDAGKLFQTDDVVRGLRAAQLAQTEETRRRQAEQEVVAKQLAWKAEVARILKLGQDAEKNGQFAPALAALQKARETEPGNVELAAALSRLEQARLKALEATTSGDQTARVKAYLAQAHARSKAKQFDAALALLQEAEKLAPSDPQVKAALVQINQLRQADTAAMAKRQQDAESAKQQALAKIQQEEEAKKQATQARQQAEAALAGGDLKTAEMALATMRRLAPRDPALIKLSQELASAQSAAARQQGQLDARAKLEAEARARQAAMNQKHSGKLGELLQNAQTAMQKKDFDSAEKLLGEALALDSTNLAVGRLQRELQATRAAEEKNKSTMSATDRKKQEAEHQKRKEQFAKLMKDGKEALNEQDLDKAIQLFTEARKLNPDDPDAALYLGMARRDVDRANAEKEDKRKAVEEEKRKEAEAAKAAMNQKSKEEADLRKKLVLDEEARKRAEQLKNMNQRLFNAAVNQSKQLLEAKRYDDAIAALVKAQELQPTNKTVAAMIELARRQKAEAMAPPAKKDPPSAKKDAPPAKKDNPPPKSSNVAQLVTQATALQKERKWEEALKVYQQVLTVSPNDAAARAGARLCEFQIHFEAGKAALGKKEKAEAVKAFEAALKTVPGHQEAQKLLKQARELK